MKGEIEGYTVLAFAKAMKTKPEYCELRWRIDETARLSRPLDLSIERKVIKSIETDAEAKDAEECLWRALVTLRKQLLGTEYQF